MFRAINSPDSNPNAVDRRGTTLNKKTNPDDISFLHNFISKFPTYESHYGSSNSNSNIKYLNPCLNIKRMYREYCLITQFEGRKVLTEWMFRHVFNTQFNLRFKPLKVDTCKTCDSIESNLKSSCGKEYEEYLIAKEDHHSLVQKYKMSFKEQNDDAKKSYEKIVIRTFDLQRALELPYLTTSVAFYSRQLWLYNLCVYDEVRQKGYMYAWPESVASRGSQEIAACVLRNLRETLPKETERLILRSDSCFGQNKNIKLSLMLKKFLDEWPGNALKTIEQQFFVVGHSYNSCDRCFGLIERQKKITEQIFLPSHWLEIMRQAKKTDPKFEVTEMRAEDFLSSSPLEALIINRKKSVDGNKINWRNLQSLIYRKDQPYMLGVRDFGVGKIPTIEISLQRRGENKKLSELHLPILYPYGRPILRKK